MLYRLPLLASIFVAFLGLSLSPAWLPEGLRAWAMPVQPVVDQETEDRRAAEQLVWNFSAKSLKILNNGTLSAEEKKQQFGTLLQASADIDDIADFCLGPYQDLPTPAQRKRYYDLFLKSVENDYLVQLNAYRKSQVQIDSSQYAEDNDDDNSEYVNIDVDTTIETNKPGQQPLDVQWKIRRTTANGKTVYKIFDVSVKGVSLALGKRDVYISLIRSKNNNFDAFLDEMAKK